MGNDTFRWRYNCRFTEQLIVNVHNNRQYTYITDLPLENSILHICECLLWSINHLRILLTFVSNFPWTNHLQLSWDLINNKHIHKYNYISHANSLFMHSKWIRERNKNKNNGGEAYSFFHSNESGSLFYDFSTYFYLKWK